MPIQTINYLQAPMSGTSPITGLGQAFSQGMKMANYPKEEQQKLIMAQLQNELLKNDVKYAPEMSAAELASKQAMAPYYQAQTKKLNAPPQYAPSSPVAKLQQDLAYAVQTYGPDSPQAKQIKQAIDVSLQGKQGVVVYDKDGKPMVQVGGTGGSGRGGVGGTFRDSNGNVVSMPTNQSTTTAQNAIMGSLNANQYINDMVKNLPKFQNPVTYGEEKLSGLSNALFGTNFPLPSEKTQGLASLKSSAEGLIKTFGIRPTDKNMETVQSILQPSLY
jgi:hypothetical protein